MRITIPTNTPGGLDAERSDHFGHCDFFTMIELDEHKEIPAVTTIENGDHEAGGCMAPVTATIDRLKFSAVAGIKDFWMSGRLETFIRSLSGDRYIYGNFNYR